MSKYFVIKSIKDSGTDIKGYFVRLDDNLAMIDDKFLMKILQMINYIREEIKKQLINKGFS